MEAQNGNEEYISGVVEKITFQNPDNGFTVLELDIGDELIPVVGTMPGVTVGEELSLRGKYDIHPTFGPQFKADVFERSMPSTSAAIFRYLAAGGIKGIGPSTAQRIVDAFGEKSLEIIEREPARLAKLRGISPAKAEKIHEEFMRQFGVREVMLFLSQYGVSPDEALEVYKQLGPGCVDKIKANPYFLCADSARFPFERVDTIAADMGIEHDFSFRVMAGVEYVLRHNLSNGHTCIPRDKLAEISGQLLTVKNDLVDITIDDMISSFKLNSMPMGGREFLFLPHMYRAESYSAQRIMAMLKFPPAAVSAADQEIDGVEKSLNIKYESLQIRAIKAALSQGLLILTGGPGTGKTTTLNAIIRIFERHEMKIALAAPTGRAAKRMTDLTGYEAKTLHRLLEVEWAAGDRPVFTRNEQNPLDCDVIIVDELSMVDAVLFESLLRAMPLGCRLIMVGDSDQLPSVGAGNVLGDLIESGVLPTVELKEVFRQAMKSVIITNAHKIVRGENPDLSRRDADFFFIGKHSPRSAAETVCDLAVRRLPAAYGFSPLSDIQVLCPSRKRDLGTVNLNNMLQQRLNPPSKDKRELSFKGFTLREGDKVMQIKNNYDIMWDKDDGSDGTGVFNGDVGILTEISLSSDTLKVRFDDREAVYSFDDADQLELAYAVTVHKSQGSEFDCVILPALDMPMPLRYRNLLYTAVTRAKKLLCVVGSQDELFQMVANNKRTRRYTALAQMLGGGHE